MQASWSWSDGIDEGPFTRGMNDTPRLEYSSTIAIDAIRKRTNCTVTFYIQCCHVALPRQSGIGRRGFDGSNDAGFGGGRGDVTRQERSRGTWRQPTKPSDTCRVARGGLGPDNGPSGCVRARVGKRRGRGGRGRGRGKQRRTTMVFAHSTRERGRGKKASHPNKRDTFIHGETRESDKRQILRESKARENGIRPPIAHRVAPA